MNDASPKLETDEATEDEAVPSPDVSPSISRLPLPSDACLDRGLASVFARPVTVVERTPFIRTSTYPSELLTLRWDGATRQVLCKYSGGRDDHRCWGHRGGLEREARVYQHVLRPLGLNDPALYGAYQDPATGWTWLVLEYLDDAMFAHHVEEPDGMLLVAGWLGRFHADGQDRLPATARRCLSAYDADYYEGWIRRTLEYSAPVRKRFPWLPEFCRRGMELLGTLLARPQTVIHGEFYGQNVLYSRGRVCPVDWESAALGAGEIDLACLVEAWSPQTVRACVGEYCRARWPEGPSADFHRALDAAEVYLLFRWLGGEPNYAGLARAQWRYGRLFELGRRWGLIPADERTAVD